ncbi:MAG: pyridoxamine 5'-phosphate oxidase [Alphaproteobacteria bacterium]|nr:MAG: pyridoxamine 5'-phosphate oxidase [Alphaproteobacteria bacterium]TAF75296.1 MAG: pyridoxamine 5'-phosphate oxidase [Alphaproteobacteria bacterium]
MSHHLYHETDPHALFQRWWEEAQAHPEVQHPSVMSLATYDGTYPQVRIVLLKHFDADGFVFFTNMQSAKSRAMIEHPRVSLCFYWEALAKQIRIAGHVREVSSVQADAYFATRPRAKQIGAWASMQSETMEHEGALQERLHEMEARFEGVDVPRPPHWSGWRVHPEIMEFWIDQPARLHDRIVFHDVDGVWTKKLLYP